MTPVLFIRKHILRMTQGEMGEALHVTQATISRWESQGFFPAEYQPRVRELGKDKREDWQDSWFFDVPEWAKKADGVEPNPDNPEAAEAA